MHFDWTNGPLREGLQCYRNREFFLAHEHWEQIWLTSEKEDKVFLQGLIQMTAAFHHLAKNNRVGASSLLRAALRRLETFPSDFGGIAVGSLRNSMVSWLDALDMDRQAPQIPFPVICESREADGTFAE
jgi:uncharacterized protein